MDPRNFGGAPAGALELPTHDGPLFVDAPDSAARLSALWTELVSGSCKIAECGFTDASCALVVTRSAAGNAPALSRRQASILERSLIEGARKSLAIDLGLSPSTLAESLKLGLAFMGLSCWPSRIPLLLVIAAHATRVADWARSASVIAADNRRFARQVVSIARPDNALSPRLSKAEWAVTRLLIEGKSHAEMARLRRTSARTVANQLAAAFERLGVSGRPELLCSLARAKLASWQLSTPIGISHSRLQSPTSLLCTASGPSG